MPYTPSHPPQGVDRELATWIENEFRQVARTFNETESLKFTVRHVAPEKPREGMTVVADGTDWNPGSGGGQYTYVNGAWVFSGPPAAGSFAPPDASYLVVGLNGTLTNERAVSFGNGLTPSDGGANGTYSVKVAGQAVGTDSLLMGDTTYGVIGDATGGNRGLTAFNNQGSSHAAAMTFHRGGIWAEHIGLDTDNKFKHGGWSAGANAWNFLHNPLANTSHSDGGSVLLTSGSAASVASVGIVLTAYTGYRALKLVIDSAVPVADDAQALLRFSTNAGSSYDSGATDYTYGFNAFSSNGSAGSSNSTGTTAIVLSRNVATHQVSNVASEGGFHSEIIIFRPTGAVQTICSYFSVFATALANTACVVTGVGMRRTAQDTDAVQFLFNGTNISSMNYALYGYP